MRTVKVSWEEIVPCSGTLEVPEQATPEEITEICDAAVRQRIREFAVAEIGPVRKILTVHWEEDGGQDSGMRFDGRIR